MKNTSFQMLIIMVLSLSAVSCYYPKVSVTRKARREILYKRKNAIVFENNQGISDTVVIFKDSGRDFESNADVWLGKLFYGSEDDRGELRSFFRDFKTYPNYEKRRFKKANICLSEGLCYSATEYDAAMTVSISGFKERYDLNDNIDSLVFKDRIYVASCGIVNPDAVKKIIYTRNEGIVMIEKNSGEIWKFTKRLK